MKEKEANKQLKMVLVFYSAIEKFGCKKRYTYLSTNEMNIKHLIMHQM